MASKLPLKPINGSNIGRPAASGLARPSGLKPPTSMLCPPMAGGLKPPTAGLKPPTAGLKPPTAGLKPPTAALKLPTAGLKLPTAGLKPPMAGLKSATAGIKPPISIGFRPSTAMKRAASPPRDDTHVSKKIKSEAKTMGKPVARKPVGPGTKVTMATRCPARLTAQPPTARAAQKSGTRPATARATRPPAPATKPTSAPSGGAKSKRAAWDYKGRLQDMEAALANYMSENERTASRVEQLEVQRQHLQGEIQVKEKITTEASEQIDGLQARVRLLEDELATSKRTLQQQVADLEFSKSTIERQRDVLAGDLQVAQQDNTGLKSNVAGLQSTIGSLTTANAGTKAELDYTQLNLKHSLEAGRLKDTAIAQHEETISTANAKMREFETERRQLHNTIQELKGNIRVFCRVRPLLGEERLGNNGEITHMAFPDQDKDSKILELEKVGELAANESFLNCPKNGKKYEFAFDRVFSPTSPQSAVFEEISQLVQSALDGYNVCIFAYGQTGSGKTFTMEGPVNKNHNNRGMIPRAVEQVFHTGANLEDKGWKYEYEASFLEIYNETIRDLLGNDSIDTKHEIKMVSKESNELVVSNLTTTPVTSEEEVHQLLQKATQNRAVAETKCNERSSRSHSVFRLKLSGVNAITEEKSVGMLNLIDLAGSERLKESGSQGARLKETQCINKSLANLGNVIMALANKDSHIPYRNSKLTHLLQNSLGGNSKTLMFVNVNPREDFSGETLCSLRFATKVNACNIGTAQKRAK